MSSGIRVNQVVAASLFVALGSSAPAVAVVATGNLGVQIEITAECRVVSADTLNFGPHGLLVANIDATSTITVQCTSGTPYTVGLGPGTSPGATVTTRKMTGTGGATVDYSLFKDSGYLQNWGNVIPADLVSGTGDGASQAIPVYGRVAAQTTPAVGTYNDTVAIEVTY
ncbi:spore coat U domain-containing protein [Phyllobacterium sp. SB3]|uniref:Csu type fimbrial protein n=1 Tax=Phyllobacterium sp. SB3 TaxID=3156073 RepID=UPI0032AF4F5F